MRFAKAFLLLWASASWAIDVIETPFVQAEKPTTLESSIYRAFLVRDACFRKAGEATEKCVARNANTPGKSPCPKLQEKSNQFCNDFYWAWVGKLQTPKEKLCAMERTTRNPNDGKEIVLSIYATPCKNCEAEKAARGPVLFLREVPAPDGFGYEQVYGSCGSAYTTEKYEWSANIECACGETIHSEETVDFDPYDPPALEFDFTKRGNPAQRTFRQRQFTLHAKPASRAEGGSAPTGRGARGRTHK